MLEGTGWRVQDMSCIGRFYKLAMTSCYPMPACGVAERTTHELSCVLGGGFRNMGLDGKREYASVSVS